MSSLFIIDKNYNSSLFCVYSKTRFCLFNLPDDNWVGVSVGTEVDKDEGIEEIEVDLSVVEVTVELDIIVEVIVDLGDVIDETVEDEDVWMYVEVGDDVTVEVTGKVDISYYLHVKFTWSLNPCLYVVLFNVPDVETVGVSVWVDVIEDDGDEVVVP